jgi:hypothetical protein
LSQLETQAKHLRNYQEAYNQIVAAHDQIESEYNDVAAERDDLRKAHDALLDRPNKHNAQASVQAMSMLQVGTLHIHDRDPDFLEAYWSKEESFAEKAMRDTAAEIRDVNAQLDEVARQLRQLETPNDASDVDTNTDISDPDEETETASLPIAEHDQPQLLDTLANRLPTASQEPRIPQPDFRFKRAGSSRRTTWADKAAVAGENEGRNGQGYVHASYQGHGVSTVKRVDDSGSRNA